MKSISRVLTICLSFSLVTSSAFADQADHVRTQIRQKISQHRQAWDAFSVPQKREMIFNETPATLAVYPDVLNISDETANKFQDELARTLSNPGTSALVKIAIFKQLRLDLEKMNKEINGAILRKEVRTQDLARASMLADIYLGIGLATGLTTTLDFGSGVMTSKTRILPQKYGGRLLVLGAIATVATLVLLSGQQEVIEENVKLIPYNEQIIGALQKHVNATNNFIKILDSQIAAFADQVILEEMAALQSAPATKE